MSLKVYNAYKYNGELYNLINQLKDIRKEYLEEKKVFISNFGNYIIKKSEVKFLEKDTKISELCDDPMGDCILGDYLKHVMLIGDNVPLNIQSSIVIYPHKTGIYLQVFGLDKKYISKINNLQDFHYQNQVDMSNYDWDTEKWDLMDSERQKELELDWENRKNIWNDIIRDNDTFSESGFYFDFHPHDYKLSYFCYQVLDLIKDKV